MGKDEPCCETCRLFGDGAIVPERDAPAMAIDPKRTWIVASHGGAPLVETELRGVRTTIGRGANNDMVLLDNTLSRQQCWIDVVDGHAFISDNNSACGTFVDGQRVNRAVVREGSVVQVGNVQLRIVTR
jgi:Inner membrane component of T3SS, cytoplasmic domain